LITRKKNQFNFSFRSRTICTYSKLKFNFYWFYQSEFTKIRENIYGHWRRCLTTWATCRLNFVTLILRFFSLYQVNIIVHHHHHLSFHDKTWREISIYSSQHPVLYCNWSWQVHSKFTCKFPIRMLIRYIQSSKVTPQTNHSTC
jgi:hypothetical protein